MKFFLSFAVLIIGVCASPYLSDIPISVDVRNERIVTGPIVSAIEDVRQAIKNAGLDPLHIQKEAINYELPVPMIFNSAVFIEEVLSTGLSNIVIHRVNYSILQSRLNFDLELPLIHFSAGAASAKAAVFGNHLGGVVSGIVNIKNIRIVGQVRINISIISGISVRSVDASLTLGDIHSKVKLVIQNEEYSDIVNEFLGSTLPDTVKTFSNEINELIEIILLQVIQENL